MTVFPFAYRMRRTFSAAFALLALTLVSPVATAAVLEFDTLTPQSIWDTGTAGGFDESVFLGAEWDTEPAQLGEIFGGEVTTPGVAPIQITPAIPRKLLTKGIPRKLLVKSKKICVKFIGCYRTKAIYSPAIPAIYSPAIPAVYTPAIPAITLNTETGAEVDVSTEGKVGLQFSTKADAGSINASIDFEADLAAPEKVDALKLFPLMATSSLQDSTAFNTNFPEISAKAEFIVGAKVDIDAEGCVVGTCKQTTTTLGTADSNGDLDPLAIELLSLNDEGNGKIEILGTDALVPNNYNFGDAIPVTAGPLGTEVGNVSVFIPDVESDSAGSADPLSSRGMGDLFSLKLDLDGIATVASGGTIPPAGATFNAGILSMSFDILDIEFGPIVEIIQDFQLETQLMVDLAFSEPVWVEGFQDRQSSLSVAFDAIPQIALNIAQTVTATPTYWLDTFLTNTTRLGIDAEFVLDVLKASFDIEVLGKEFNLGELGPLLSVIKRFDVAELPALFDETFAVEGFNRITGDALTFSTAVHDPSPTETTLGDAVATLITGSPVEISQTVTEPAGATFEFSFEYLFATATGVLDVFLGDALITSIESPGVMDAFGLFSQILNTADFFNALNGLGALDLRFLLNQSPGATEQAVLLLDNVSFPGLLDGDFNQGSVTGLLPVSWDANASPGAFAGVTLVSDEVSAPPILWLLLIGLLTLFTARRAGISAHGRARSIKD